MFLGKLHGSFAQSQARFFACKLWQHNKSIVMKLRKLSIGKNWSHVELLSSRIFKIGMLRKCSG